MNENTSEEYIPESPPPYESEENKWLSYLPEIDRCYHCSNKTVLKLRSHYTTFITESDYINGHDFTFEVTWAILECLSCNRPIFLELQSGTYFSGDRVLYPVRRKFQSLPSKIRTEYDAALLVRNIAPNAFAVLIGRVLDAVCSQEKAQGKRLADKLKYLADAGRIPQELAQMATYLRQLRNLGAHVDDDEVTQEDVSTILDFVEIILEYLYIIPEKITKIKGRINIKQPNS